MNKEKQNKTKIVLFRVTIPEWENLEKKAGKNKVSSYIRKKLFK